MNIKPGYTYDDVLLVPKRTSIRHRSDVDLTVNFIEDIKTLPIISANMKHVTDFDMAIALTELNCMSLLHRFDSVDNRISTFKRILNVGNNSSHVGISIGAIKSELDVFSLFYNEFKNDLKIVCIDIAHGHSDICVNAIDTIKNISPDCLLIAGNVATPDGAYDLWKAGADVIKLGIGNGSSCSTRVETGNGVPQLTALSDIWDYFKSFKNRPKIIADGGLSKVGNIVKALCFSDCVMLGGMLAGTDESPGDIINKDGKQYKAYSGSSTFKTRNVEGYSGLVPYKGSVELVINKIIDGLQSGFSYQGARNIEELRKDPEFVLITNSGFVESGAHDILL